MSQLPRVGEVVDEVFQVESELGHGNFGAVYRVRDLLEGRTLALKVLKPGPHDEQELRHRFEREARLIYSLRHPHVLRVYYYGQTARGLPYMAMEFLEGTDLRTLLRHHGPLSPRLVNRIALETLSALEAAHALGIVHRDLKPANIFLVNDGARGHVKVLDFGFAKALDDGGAQQELTAAKTLVGTPAYMSPELVHKKNVGPPADIYALGLIMAEMLTGEKIVQIDSVYDTIMFQASDKPFKLPRQVTESAFAEVIARAVEKDVTRRYQTPTEMVLDLETLPQSAAGRGRMSSAAQLSAAGYDDALTTPHSTGLPSLQEVDAALGDDDAQTRTNPRASIDPFADFPSYEESEASGEWASAELDSTARRVGYELSGVQARAAAASLEYQPDAAAAQPAARPDARPPTASAQAVDLVSVEADTSQSLSITQPAALPPASAPLSGRYGHEFQDPSWVSQPLDFGPTTEFDRDQHLSGFDAPVPTPQPRPGTPAGAQGRAGVLKEIVIGVVIGGAILGLFLYMLQYWQ